MKLSLAFAIISPLVAAFVVGATLLIRKEWMSEQSAARVIRAGLALSVLGSIASVLTYVGVPGDAVRGEIMYGNWLAVGSYSIPLTLMIDRGALVFSLLASMLTALVASFSKTYLHKDAGFDRFYYLLGVFAGGTQLVAFAGALDLFFAGWEMIGISSALFIGFFHERDEPVRSSVRAFATYRLCDIGLLIGIVAVHELLGSTQLSALSRASTLGAWQVSAVALLFLVAAMGKSAQLPFSGWLPRAMEGPTPSSALFYGAISIHAGLYLLLRVAPVIHAAPFVSAFGVFVGLTTALYAAAVARTNTDAKSALAHAALAQIGLIMAEICLGLTTLALVHLTCHAMLRAFQYLRAPNMIHDSHAHGTSRETSGVLARRMPKFSQRVYASALHRWRLDERLDMAVAPVLALARVLDRVDRRVRIAFASTQAAS